jgi:hypothetical protein
MRKSITLTHSESSPRKAEIRWAAYDRLETGGRLFECSGMGKSNAVLEYGQHLLDSRWIPDSAPQFTLSVEDLHGLFETLQTNDSEAFAAGFLSLVPLFVSESWSTFTPVQLEYLKLDAVRACFRPMSSWVANHYTCFMTVILRLSDWKWPELYPQILHSRHDLEVLGFLIPQLLPSIDPEFLSEIRSGLLDKIFNCFPLVCYAAQLRLLQSLHWLKLGDFSADFVQHVWQFILGLCHSHSDDCDFFFQILESIFGDPDAIRQLDSPPMDSDEAFMDFLPFIPYLCDERFEAAIRRLIDSVVALVSTDLPLDFSKRLSLATHKKLTPGQFGILQSVLSDSATSPPLHIAAIFTIVHFLPQGVTESSTIASLGLTWFPNFPFGHSLEQKVWLFSLSILTPSLTAAGLFPPNLEIPILALLQSTDPQMHALALRVVRSVFKHGSFTPEPGSSICS